MKKIKFILLFILSLFLTIFFSIYQRTTGPTYPVKAKLLILDKEYKLKLPHSANTGKDLEIFLPIKNEFLKADLHFQNYSEDKEWEKVEFQRKSDGIYAKLKSLPPAGKYQYFLKLFFFDRTIQIPEKPIFIRFKGKVPDLILIVHILIIFSGFLFSIYTGLFTFFIGINKKLTFITFILFLAGAGILGPIVQYYAFGQFWTGFPFGKDLTDNKGLFLILFWGISYFQVRKGKGKGWVLLSFLISILVFFIPHSLWGSELKGGKIKTGP